MKNYSLMFVSLLLLSACNTQKKAAIKQQTYMENTYVEIKKSVPEAEVSLLNDTVKVLFPEHLLFTIGNAEIITENYPLLERFANALNKYNTTSILINGYTDNSGEEDVNEVLSRNRAINTKEILAKYFVDNNRMFTWGRGIKDPIASNKTAEGRRKNRRVEFIILYSYTHVAESASE